MSLWLLFGGLAIAVAMVIAVGARNARPGWWRRDRLLLIGLALLIAGAIGIAIGFGIPPHEERSGTATPVVVAAGASAVLVGLWIAAHREPAPARRVSRPVCGRARSASATLDREAEAERDQHEAGEPLDRPADATS